MKLEKRELASISGGAVNATLINSLARIIQTVYDIGYAIGSSIKSIFNKKSCS